MRPLKSTLCLQNLYLMKKIVLTNQSEIEGYLDQITHSAEEAQLRVVETGESALAMEFFERLRFEKLGYDPLNSSRELNFIEQLNQSFTYLASFKAAKYIFQNHVGISELILNLGTTPGPDIETEDCGGISAEVFAATWPKSNNKLSKDIMKVQATKAKHKYVFFMCPGIDWGEFNQDISKDVTVWSLGF